MIINKKLGYVLVVSSFLFLWIHIFVFFDALYKWIFALMVTDDDNLADNHLLEASPMIDFAGSTLGIATLLIIPFVLGALLFSIGIYIIKWHCRVKSTK